MQPSYPGASEEAERRSYFQKGEWRGKVIFSRKSGERFLCNVSYGLLKDAEGNVSGSVAVIRDKSEQEKKEKQLSYLAELVNKTYDAIISIDTSFRIISWNKGAQIIYGYTAGEAIGKDVAVLLHWENAATCFKEINQKPGKQTYWQGEEKHFHQSGSEVYALLSVSLIHDEQQSVTGYVIVGKGISPRKQLENKLQRLNQELEQRVQRKARELTHVFERVTDGFIAFDKNWNYRYLNKKASEILGRSPDELIGKNIWTEYPEKLQEPLYHQFFRSHGNAETETCTSMESNLPWVVRSLIVSLARWAVLCICKILPIRKARNNHWKKAGNGMPVSWKRCRKEYGM
jgi:PAS domain S-box-containing protein